MLEGLFNPDLKWKKRRALAAHTGDESLASGDPWTMTDGKTFLRWRLRRGIPAANSVLKNLQKLLKEWRRSGVREFLREIEMIAHMALGLGGKPPPKPPPGWVPPASSSSAGAGAGGGTTGSAGDGVAAGSGAPGFDGSNSASSFAWLGSGRGGEKWSDLLQQRPGVPSAGGGAVEAGNEEDGGSAVEAGNAETDATGVRRESGDEEDGGFPGRDETPIPREDASDEEELGAQDAQHEFKDEHAQHEFKDEHGGEDAWDSWQEGKDAAEGGDGRDLLHTVSTSENGDGHNDPHPHPPSAGSEDTEKLTAEEKSALGMDGSGEESLVERGLGGAAGTGRGQGRSTNEHAGLRTHPSPLTTDTQDQSAQAPAPQGGTTPDTTPGTVYHGTVYQPPQQNQDTDITPATSQLWYMQSGTQSSSAQSSPTAQAIDPATGTNLSAANLSAEVTNVSTQILVSTTSNGGTSNGMNTTAASGGIMGANNLSADFSPPTAAEARAKELFQYPIYRAGDETPGFDHFSSLYSSRWLEDAEAPALLSKMDEANWAELQTNLALARRTRLPESAFHPWEKGAGLSGLSKNPEDRRGGQQVRTAFYTRRIITVVRLCIKRPRIISHAPRDPTTGHLRLIEFKLMSMSSYRWGIMDRTARMGRTGPDLLPIGCPSGGRKRGNWTPTMSIRWRE